MGSNDRTTTETVVPIEMTTMNVVIATKPKVNLLKGLGAGVGLGSLR